MLCNNLIYDVKSMSQLKLMRNKKKKLIPRIVRTPLIYSNIESSKITVTITYSISSLTITDHKIRQHGT